MIDGNKLGTVGFEKLGTPYSEMDCQAFVEWCLRQCGLKKDLAGSNAWYREVMKNGAILTPEECVKQFGKVPAGAFLFIHALDGGEEKRGYHDGLGNASHIGIVTGKGEGAIHSSSSRGCVAESKFRSRTINGGWNKVGLWNQVSYDYGGTEQGDGSSRTASAEPGNRPRRSAIVHAGQGSTVNTRQGPGTSYALSKAGRIPVGTVVEILKQLNGWCRIRYVDPDNAVWYCWMKEDFLQPAEPEDAEPGDGSPRTASAEPGNRPRRSASALYEVTIQHLTDEDVNALKTAYPDCTVREEAG